MPVILGTMTSIPAIKGVEIGPAFENACKWGSQVHDEIILQGQNLKRRTNRGGGLEGGISTGEPIVVRVAMKPISTVVQGLNSVNLATAEATLTKYERSDFCAVPRAVSIGEAMLAIVLSGALLDKLGGDNMGEIKERFGRLRRSCLKDLPMDNQSWYMKYTESPL